MPQPQRTMEIIDTYGNEIVQITVDFLKGKITEKERNELYAKAGVKHMLEISSEKQAERERVVGEIEKLRKPFLEFGKTLKYVLPIKSQGYNQAIEDVKALLSKK